MDNKIKLLFGVLVMVCASFLLDGVIGGSSLMVAGNDSNPMKTCRVIVADYLVEEGTWHPGNEYTYSAVAATCEDYPKNGVFPGIAAVTGVKKVRCKNLGWSAASGAVAEVLPVSGLPKTQICLTRMVDYTSGDGTNKTEKIPDPATTACKSNTATPPPAYAVSTVLTITAKPASTNTEVDIRGPVLAGGRCTSMNTYPVLRCGSTNGYPDFKTAPNVACRAGTRCADGKTIPGPVCAPMCDPDAKPTICQTDPELIDSGLTSCEQIAGGNYCA